jgi:hypothetical protein
METFERALDLGWDVIESGALLLLDSTLTQIFQCNLIKRGPVLYTLKNISKFGL